MEKFLTIKIPKGFMNCAVTIDNFFIADTNHAANWDTLKFPLPPGKWAIKNDKNYPYIELVSYVSPDEKLSAEQLE